MAEWQPPNLTVKDLDAPNTRHTRQIKAHVTFWLFLFLKEKLKDRPLRGIQSLHRVITYLWDKLTFEDVQTVFLEWMNHLSWVVENKGEYFIK
jgi:hypothetical protein